MFQASGVLHYSTTDGYRLVADMDPSIGSYYRSLLPKEWNVIAGRHLAHVTIVRCYQEVPPNLGVWGKYEGEKIIFHYEPGVRYDEAYFWLRVLCVRIEEIRTELGLSSDRKAGYNVPPDGFKKYFHATIGSKKFINGH